MALSIVLNSLVKFTVPLFAIPESCSLLCFQNKTYANILHSQRYVFSQSKNKKGFKLCPIH